MLKKIASYFFIVFGLVVLWASTSREAMAFISNARDNKFWWGTYQCLHGDLVSMSYLDFVKAFNPPNPPRHAKRTAYTGTKNIALYLDGDSYTWPVRDTNFAGVSEYHFIERIHGGSYHLDSSKKNILLIEISERYFYSYFSGQQMINEVLDTTIKKKSVSGIFPVTAPNLLYASLFTGLTTTTFFNKYINQNLQGNLFNYNFSMPMFEAKAALNYYVFNRASGDVVISDDRKFLFLKETVDKNDIHSSYRPLNNDEITILVNNLNVLYDHYKAEGFSEVYLSIIPNSATIQQPEGYNKLIPRIQDAPNLRMKTIDAYTTFRKTRQVLYWPGDTHWNYDGMELWLDIVNDRFINDYALHQ